MSRMIGSPWLFSWYAPVMIADLIAIGDQSGWRCLIRIARPAMCGLDIDVPDMKPYVSPNCVAYGATDASTSTPGAVMSGLRMSPYAICAGPSDEKSAMLGAT